MHAWLCENPTGVDALTWKELPTPQPGPGQVLIEIKAASLNFPDLLIVQNKYQIKPPLPFVPGLRIRRRGRGSRRRRHAPAGRPERRLPVGHRRLRHPHAGAGRAVHAAARGLRPCRCGGLHHDLCDVVARADGPRATQGRRNRAGARRGRRRRHRGDPDRQGRRRQGDRRGVDRREMRALQIHWRRSSRSTTRRTRCPMVFAMPSRQRPTAKVRMSFTTPWAANLPNPRSARSAGAAAIWSSASQPAPFRRCH